MIDVLPLMFADDGAVPNNPTLPALIYKAAFDLAAATDPAREIERRFAAHGWGHGLWRDGIYPFAHYHSMIHEALGIAHGHATVRLGGDTGKTLELEPGDVAVLPAGTGHQRLSGSDDFLVVGAYPPQGTYDLCRADNPADRDRALRTIARVPLPDSDPVHGTAGPLLDFWHR